MRKGSAVTYGETPKIGWTPEELRLLESLPDNRQGVVYNEALGNFSLVAKMTLDLDIVDWIYAAPLAEC